MWEAARRLRFNNEIENLRQELPESEHTAKVVVIQAAIKYIQEAKALKESLLAGNEAQELSKYCHLYPYHKVICRIDKKLEMGGVLLL